MNDTYFTLAFSAFSGIGTVRFEKLVAAFGFSHNAWYADVQLLEKIVGPLTAKRFDEFRKRFDVEKYAAEIHAKHVDWFVPKDKKYPILLKQLPHPPFILFAKGNIQLLKTDKTIGIVGTRKVTEYGKQVTEMFTQGLTQSGFTIVSGMALGVDGIAHTAALKNNGATIAVLGSGVDVPTPREHAHLYQQILDANGLIVSTFSPGEDASKGSFPARNAIIAGLSQGILVTEGAADSGSLITAEYAKKFNRFLFAVPGQITSQLSQGTNKLIKNGAIPVDTVQDILDSLGIMETHNADYSSSKARSSHFVRTIQVTPQEEEILHLLQNGPLLFDEIVRTIGKDSKEVGSLLSLMELKGMIKSTQEGKYMI